MTACVMYLSSLKVFVVCCTAETEANQASKKLHVLLEGEQHALKAFAAKIHMLALAASSSHSNI